MKIVVVSFKTPLPPVRPPVRPQSSLPPVRPSARAGAGRTYIHKTPDRPPWAAVIRKHHTFPQNSIVLSEFLSAQDNSKTKNIATSDTLEN